MSSQQKARILIVDDEVSIRNLIRASLNSQSYAVEEADSAQDGLEKTNDFHPHLIILDLGLPDFSGLELLKRLRSWTEIPVIILTVQDNESFKVELLDAGADDYLTKPFGIQELLARVRVGLRHHSLIEATPVFQSGDLSVNLNEHAVFRDGRAVKLTATEYELLTQLIRHQGKVVSQNHLLESVWGKDAKDQSHYLRIYIGQLRKKLETDPAKPTHILTEPGVGYRIV